MALLAVFYHHVLPRGRACERRREADVERIAVRSDLANDVGLPIAHFGRAGEMRCRSATRYPVGIRRTQAPAAQRRVVRALHDDERIAPEILRRHEPGRSARLGAPADAEAAALADRVALEPAVPAELNAVLGLDRTGAAGQPPADELAEGPLADEADAGRVTLVGDRESALARDRANLGLAKPADREFAVRELPRIQRVQEVALVLPAVHAPQQAATRADAGVMAGRESLRPEPPCVLEADAELYLAIAEHVGVGGPAGFQLREEMREHSLAIIRLEARLVQGDAELLADAPRILEIRGRGAVPILVLGPVRHEEALDAVARIQ